MAELHITTTTEGVARKQVLDKGETSLGRSESCGIVVIDKAMSRHHANIRATNEGFLLEDAGSANGCFVNGRKVTRHLLEDGDEIRLGSTYFKFSDPKDPEATVLLDAAEEVRKAKEEMTRVQASPMPPPAAAPHAPQPPPAAPPAAAAPPPRPPAAAPAPPQYPPAAAPMPPPLAPQPPPRVAVPAATPPMRAPQVAPAVAAASAGGEYAGFWIRVLAYLIDSVIISLGMMVVYVPATFIGVPLANRGNALGAIIMILAGLTATALAFGYVLFFWATRDATPGKQILGLEIVRDDGVRPLGWGKAALRLLGYMVSGAVLYVGYIMVAFMDRKRGLHDMIAGTTVRKR